MAFPTTAVKDTFTRANESPLGTSSDSTAYSGTQLSGGTNLLKFVTNTARTQILTAGQRNDQYFTTNYGADCEIYVTLSTKQGTNLQLYIRVQQEGTANFDGYRLIWTFASGAWSLDRWTNNASAAVINSGTQACASGDSIGIECIGTTITADYKASGGSWASLGGGTDSTYASAGKIALSGVADGSVSPILDDFGGGTRIAPASTRRLLPLLGAG